MTSFATLRVCDVGSVNLTAKPEPVETRCPPCKYLYINDNICLLIEMRPSEATMWCQERDRESKREGQRERESGPVWEREAGRLKGNEWETCPVAVGNEENPE